VGLNDCDDGFRPSAPSPPSAFFVVKASPCRRAGKKADVVRAAFE
jgi:hypothetical protein